MDSALAALARDIRERRVIPPAPQSKLGIGDKDLTDPVLVHEDIGLPASFVIEYVDLGGTITERVVTLQAFEGGAEARRFVAYCYLRKDYRRFLAGSINRMFGLDGQPLDPDEHLGFLFGLSAEREGDDRLVWAMSIVMFVARVDGEFHTLERDAVVQILGEFLARFDQSKSGDKARESAEIDPNLAEVVFGFAPSGEHVLHAIERLREEPDFVEMSEFLIDALDRIVDADGEQHGEELIWFGDLVEALQP